MQDVTEYYRYCPDQPKVRISDAVCIGRRRSRYPQCPGCKFNDTEQEAGAESGPYGASASADNIERLFVGHRALAKYPDELNEETAWRIGHASASYLRGALRGLDRSDPVATTVVVGRDARQSSLPLAEAFIDGVRSTGANVVDVGVIDAAQLYFAVNHLRACGGVHVTGSAAPAPYNGFCFTGQRARPVGPDTGLLDISRIAQNMSRHNTGQQGALRTVDLAVEYRSFVRSHLQSPRELKIVADASNGVAGHWIPVLFDDVGELEFICINTGANAEFAHDPDPLRAENLHELQERVRTDAADFGVCFDGDAGRLVLVDENGNELRSDILTAILARYFLERHPGSTVVYDLRCSRVVAEEIKAAGGVPRRERVGRPFLKKAVAESKAMFGGGLGGRFYFRDNFCCDSAVLALAHLITVLSRTQSSLAELAKPLQRYASSGLRIIAHAAPESAIRKLAAVYSGARMDFLDGVTVQYDDWWFNARTSLNNVEPALGLVVEASSQKQMRQKVREITAHLDDEKKR